MSSSQALGGTSRPGRILGPSLDKIIKNVAWRKHSALVAACKSALDRLDALADPPAPFPDSPLPSFSSEDAESLLRPLALALESASPKIAEPALECAHKLLSHGLLRCEVDRIPDPPSTDAPPVSRLFDSACRCGGLGDEAVELALLRTLLSAVRSHFLSIRGESLVQIVKTCFNVYLGSLSGTNQICAKAALAQILIIVYARVEADSMDVSVRPISVGVLLELSDKSLNDLSLVQFVQNFINEVVEGTEGIAIVPRLPEPRVSRVATAPSPSESRGSSSVGESGRVESEDGEANRGGDSGGESKIREDGFFLFKNLCKFSMKFSTQEKAEDHMVLRGKVLSLELLKVVMGNAGPIWRTNEK